MANDTRRARMQNGLMQRNASDATIAAAFRAA
jgi:hypothetical protein